MTEEYELSEDPAYKLSKDEKGCRIRVDGRGHYFATRDDKLLYPAAMEITGQEIFCTVREADGSTAVIVGKNPEAAPLEGLAETEIQIYNHPEITKKITESLFYTDEKGQRKPTPFAAVLRECVKNRLAQKNSKNPGIDEILGAVNELKDGTLEEQAVYGMFRAHLVENGLMPIDENGRPYDLSVMHIPPFPPALLQMKCPDKELVDRVLMYYHLNRTEHHVVDPRDILQCFNKLKTELPEVFVQLHNYLVKDELIPATQMRSEINLAPEMMAYLCAVQPDYMEPVISHINRTMSAALEKNGKKYMFDITKKDQEWIKKYTPQLNRMIANMRFGTVADQEKYHKFCKVAPLLEDWIFLEEPTYPEEARSMFTRAQAKQARATIETRL
jgi:hypothetical protein